MSDESDRRIAPVSQVSDVVIDDNVEAADEAYVGVCNAARDRPDLALNPYFSALRDTARDRFMVLFQRSA